MMRSENSETTLWSHLVKSNGFLLALEERPLQALGMGLVTGCGSSAAVRDRTASDAPPVQAQ